MMLAENPHLNDDLRAIASQVMDFCEKEVRPFGDEWEKAGKVPRDVLRKMGELGMFSLRVPTERDGLGLGDPRLNPAQARDSVQGLDFEQCSEAIGHVRVRARSRGRVPQAVPSTRPPFRSRPRCRAQAFPGDLQMPEQDQTPSAQTLYCSALSPRGGPWGA